MTEDQSQHWHWEIRKRRTSNRPGVRARPHPISESPRIPVLYSREVVVVVGVPITTGFGWFPRRGGGATKPGYNLKNKTKSSIFHLCQVGCECTPVCMTQFHLHVVDVQL